MGQRLPGPRWHGDRMSAPVGSPASATQLAVRIHQTDTSSWQRASGLLVTWERACWAHAAVLTELLQNAWKLISWVAIHALSHRTL